MCLQVVFQCILAFPSMAGFCITGCPYFDAILLVGHVLSETTRLPEWIGAQYRGDQDCKTKVKFQPTYLTHSWCHPSRLVISRVILSIDGDMKSWNAYGISSTRMTANLYSLPQLWFGDVDHFILPSLDACVPSVDGDCCISWFLPFGEYTAVLVYPLNSPHCISNNIFLCLWKMLCLWNIFFYITIPV